MSKVPVILAGAGAAALVLIGWSRLSKAATNAGGGHAPPIYVREQRENGREVLVDQYGNETLICFPSEHGRESEVPCIREAPPGSWATLTEQERAQILAEQAAADAARRARAQQCVAEGKDPIFCRTPEEQAAITEAGSQQADHDRDIAFSSGDWHTILYWVQLDGVPDANLRRQRLADAGVLQTVYLKQVNLDAGVSAWSSLWTYYQVQAVKDWHSLRRSQQQLLFQGRWELFMSVWVKPPLVANVAPNLVTFVASP